MLIFSERGQRRHDDPRFQVRAQLPSDRRRGEGTRTGEAVRGEGEDDDDRRRREVLLLRLGVVRVEST